ncbi:MAG TPA: hypothetical protein VFK40_11135 [Nitrososphaeraceae archaeon]|nr:hypothetical protein [Nitrososphaeraceae archaeon]
MKLEDRKKLSNDKVMFSQEHMTEFNKAVYYLIVQFVTKLTLIKFTNFYFYLPIYHSIKSDFSNSKN